MSAMRLTTKKGRLQRKIIKNQHTNVTRVNSDLKEEIK